MGDGDDIAGELIIPVADPAFDIGIGLAALRRQRPLFGQALGVENRIGGLHFRQGRALPFAIADLAQPRIERVILDRQLQGLAHQLHGGAGAAERARDIRQPHRVMAVACDQLAQDVAGLHGLDPAERVERNVLRALQAAECIPFRLAVADVVDRGPGHCG